MKKILCSLTLIALSSFSALATDCSFKIIEVNDYQDCDTAEGKECYPAGPYLTPIYDELYKFGYNSRVTNPDEAAGLDIEILMFANLIPGPPAKGEGLVKLTIKDNNIHGATHSHREDTGKVSRERMFRRLGDSAKKMPSWISKMVRPCQNN